MKHLWMHFQIKSIYLLYILIAMTLVEHDCLQLADHYSVDWKEITSVYGNDLNNLINFCDWIKRSSEAMFSLIDSLHFMIVLIAITDGCF